MNENKKDLPLMSVDYTLAVRPSTEPKTRRQVMNNSNTVVGLDVHKNSISIAVAEIGGSMEVRHFGKIGGTMDALDRAVRKLVSTGATLRFVYEAGPCGFEIYRHLTAKGFSCKVIAPSRTPKKSGDRIKNDRRDAETLARLERAGELTAIHVPREEDEAMRDLTRAREDAVKAQKTARYQLSAFLLRYGKRYPGKASWTPSHMRWLSDVALPHPSQQIVLQEYINAVSVCSERVDRLMDQIVSLLPAWRMYPVVKALQALRGVALIVAATTVAEIGDMSRFAKPRQLMAYLGLVPSEDSTGDSIHRGSITKTGNGHVRRALIEASHAYGFPARVSRHLLKRHEGLPQSVLAIAWKAQVRLCGRFRRLMARGKLKTKVVTAIARELSGFMWAVAREVEV
jgi:transposase